MCPTRFPFLSSRMSISFTRAITGLNPLRDGRDDCSLGTGADTSIPAVEDMVDLFGQACTSVEPQPGPRGRIAQNGLWVSGTARQKSGECRPPRRFAHSLVSKIAGDSNLVLGIITERRVDGSRCHQQHAARMHWNRDRSQRREQRFSDCQALIHGTMRDQIPAMAPRQDLQVTILNCGLGEGEVIRRADD